MVKIACLAENTSSSPQFGHVHGLSLYIETNKHKLIFDLGPNDTFLKNARKLGIDIKDVDTVIISHGHFDHGGGLSTFLRFNDKAKIYIRESAFQKFYTKVGPLKKYIGLLRELKYDQRLVFTFDTFSIDNELSLFSGVKTDILRSSMNNLLMVKNDNNELMEDNFDHEQNLVITNDNRKILISGCSHTGIVNILRTYSERYFLEKEPLTYVLGGFHFFNPVTGRFVDDTYIDQITYFLLNSKLFFYTFHCTGVEAYERMKNSMQDKLKYLSSGEIIEI